MSESNYIRQRDNTSEHGQSRDLSYPPLPEPLPVAVYDNHAHLEIADGDLSSGAGPMDYREHLELAASVGVKGAIQVGGDLETSRWSAEVAAREPRLLAAVAILEHAMELEKISGANTGVLVSLDKEGEVDR